MYTDEDYLRAGMAHAQEKAQIEGLRFYEPVSHPDDLRLFDLICTDMETAEIAIQDYTVCPHKTLETKKFPLNELFNSNVAIRHGKKLLHKTQKA